MKVLSCVHVLPQRLDGAGAVHDVGVRRIGEQFLDVIGAEGAVALRTGRPSRCRSSRDGFAQAAVDAAPVALGGLVEGDGTGRLGTLESARRVLLLLTTITRSTSGCSRKSLTASAMLSSSL